MELPSVVGDICSYILYEYKDKESKFAIGSISRDRFIEVNESDKDVVMSTIGFMDGKHSFEQIESEVLSITGRKLNTSKLYSILAEANLIYEDNNSNAKKNEFETLGFKIFDVNIERIKKLFSSFSFLAVPLSICTVVLILFTLVYVFFNRQNVSSVSLFGFQDHYIRNYICLFLISALSISLHEIAHGITASRYGIVPKKLSLSLYLYISPIVYIKLPGLYTVKPKVRIHIWLAGVTVNAILSCMGLIISIILNKNGGSQFAISILNYLWYINLTLIIANLCPLMPLDGYFILATLMKIPNLRRGSFASIRKSIEYKKFKITPGQFFYFFLSVVAMGFIFLKEIIAMVSIFISNLPQGIGSAFWSIKQYVIIILVMVVLNIVRSRVRAGGKSNEQHNSSCES